MIDVINCFLTLIFGISLPIFFKLCMKRSSFKTIFFALKLSRGGVCCMPAALLLRGCILLLGSKNYAAVTTADQVYFTVLDLKKKQFSSLFRGFEPFVDDEVGESIQVRSSRLFPAIWGERPQAKIGN